MIAMLEDSYPQKKQTLLNRKQIKCNVFERELPPSNKTSLTYNKLEEYKN